MPAAVVAFAVVWILGLLTWVAGAVCFFRARRHYQGPRGLLASLFPLGRLWPSNYAAPGVSLLRWQYLFIAIFLALVAIGFGIAETQFHGYQL